MISIHPWNYYATILKKSDVREVADDVETFTKI